MPGTELIKYGTEIVTDPGVQRLIGQVVGSPASEAGAWLADEIRYRRVRRQIKIFTRTAAMLREAGFEVHELRPVDLGVLVPLLESGSLQEDESMTDRWAALLAAAATNPDGVPPSYPEILRQLTPREAAILDGIYEQAGGSWMESAYEPDLIASRAGFAVDRVVLSVENLLRLRLLKTRSLTYPGATVEDSKVLLTALGHDFVSACRPPTRR